MYKVFYNKKAIHFVKSINERIFSMEDAVIYSYQSKKGMMEAYNDFICNPSLNDLYIYSKTDLNIIFKKFCEHFKVVVAAGGLMTRGWTKQYLFIFRRGKWDLPKGKKEEGEKVHITAVREVEEETGIDKVEIIKRLIDTYHIYSEDKVVLKKTCWYLMKTFTDLTPTPQIEEDITDVRWFRKAELEVILENTYPSIKLLIDTYLKKKKKR